MVYAARIHAGQRRKKTNMPYIAHLLAVASIILEFGGGEEEAIAGLLHDAVEDGGGPRRLDEIQSRFGDTVAEIVAACTDSDQLPRPPWRDRKTAYLAHIPQASSSVRLVSAADKLHNAQSLLRNYRHLGDSIWERYNGGKDGTLWYYSSLANVFDSTESTPLTQELKRVVAQIETLARQTLPIS